MDRPEATAPPRAGAPAVTRPHHTDPLLVASVAAGGALGSLGRYGLAVAVPPRGGWPLATLTVNLVGAFLLGLLLEALASAGAETARRRWLRLTLGTGVLGGFTTYSTFALDLHGLLADERYGLAAAYGLGSVAVGLAVCAAGVRLGGARRRSRTAGGAVGGATERAADGTTGPAAGEGVRP